MPLYPMTKRYDSPRERLFFSPRRLSSLRDATPTRRFANANANERLSLTAGDRQRLWISVCVFIALCTLPLSKGGGFGTLVSAKPLPQSAVITSRANLKVPPKDRISPPPVDAVLANVRLKPSSPARVRRTVTTTGNQSSRTAQNDRDRSMRGISHLIDTERNTNVEPVNRLIGR